MSEPFDLSDFRQQLSTQWLGQDCRYFEALDSTNSYVKNLKPEEVQHGTVVLTDDQTQGRGQYDRAWQVQPAQNLTFSIVFKPQDMTGIHALTLACALTVVELINNLEQEPCASIKWPNDVLMNQKKVAGLLTETFFLGDKIERLIIGIGLNVNQERYEGELSQKATSIHLETGDKKSRERLLNELLRRIEFKYYLWNRKQPDLFKQINRKINGYGQWVKLKVNDQMKKSSFKLLGINEFGQLLVLNREGGIESFSYEQIRIVTD